MLSRRYFSNITSPPWPSLSSTSLADHVSGHTRYPHDHVSIMKIARNSKATIFPTLTFNNIFTISKAPLYESFLPLPSLLSSTLERDGEETGSSRVPTIRSTPLYLDPREIFKSRSITDKFYYALDGDLERCESWDKILRIFFFFFDFFFSSDRETRWIIWTYRRTVNSSLTIIIIISLLFNRATKNPVRADKFYHTCARRRFGKMWKLG